MAGLMASQVGCHGPRLSALGQFAKAARFERFEQHGAHVAGEEGPIEKLAGIVAVHGRGAGQLPHRQKRLVALAEIGGGDSAVEQGQRGIGQIERVQRRAGPVRVPNCTA
jgi:hypothetical protein